MLESVQFGLTAISCGLDIARGVQAISNEVAVNQAVIDIQRSLLDAQRGLQEAQARHLADEQRINELLRQIQALKEWGSEREKYELVAIRGGAFAYMLKRESAAEVPAHWLCTTCFDEGKKSIMQSHGDVRAGAGEQKYACNACKASFVVTARMRPTYSWQG